MKMKKTKLLMAFIMVFALSFALYGCGTDDKDSGQKTDNAEEEKKEEKKEEQKENTDTDDSDSADKEEEPADRAAGVGATVEEDPWKITLLDAKQYDVIEDDYLPSEPEDGKVYLTLFFEIENISDEDQSFSSICYDTYVDGESIPESILLIDVDGYSIIDGTVAPGEKSQGYSVWEVDQNWEEFEFNYSELSFVETTPKMTFIIKASDLG